MNIEINFCFNSSCYSYYYDTILVIFRLTDAVFNFIKLNELPVIKLFQ